MAMGRLPEKGGEWASYTMSKRRNWAGRPLAFTFKRRLVMSWLLMLSVKVVSGIPGLLGASAIRDLQKKAASALMEATGDLLNADEEEKEGEGTVFASDPIKTRTFGPDCAWNFHGTLEDLAPIAPEPHVVYQTTVLTLRPGDTTVYRLTGSFPLVRYFSFQTYTVPTYQPIATLKDYNFVAKDGVNPFTDTRVTCPEAPGTYEVYVTSTGTQGYPNELRGAPTEEELNRVDRAAGFKTTLLFMRLYAKDPILSTNTTLLRERQQYRDFGYVKSPLVEYRVGNEGPWQELKACTADVANLASSLYNNILTTPQFYLPVRQFPINCPMATTDGVTSDFFLFKTGDNKFLDGYVGFKNQDTSYICWCDFTRRISDEFVVVVTGTLPLTPYGLFKDIKVADRQAYDSRYVSFHAVDFAPPIPSLSAVYDQDMIDYYAGGDRAAGTGGKKWDGRYRIVGARTRQIASACGILEQEPSVFLSFTRSEGQKIPEEVDQLNAPAIIYRDILPRVIDLGEAGHSSTDVNQRCQGAQCRDPAFYRSIMGDHYPQITVYKCDTWAKKATRLTD